MIEKFKKRYYELMNAVSDDESDATFLKFLDVTYNILMTCFVVFGIISAYFFITRELL